MSECREIRILIEKGLNREMSRKERRDLRRHICRCPDCLREFEKWQKVEKVLSDLPKPKCPNAVMETILSNTIGSKPKKIRRIRYRFVPGHAGWKWAGAGIALALILLFTIIHPVLDHKKVEEVTYSQDEVLKARQQAKWSLTYVAQMLQKSERNAIDNAIVVQLPKTVRKVVKNAVPILKGGS